MKETIKNIAKIGSLFVLILLVSSCEFELPEAGSEVDNTPPTAMFIAEQSEIDFLAFNFGNLSDNATDYEWDFGDGSGSMEVEPTHTFGAEGTYSVSLVATDKLGASSTYNMDLLVEEPPAPEAKLPEIQEAGFEDLDLPDGTGDGRDSWRNSDLGGVPQITSSPVYEGSQAAKLPSDGSRILYQELEVSPNVDYVLTYYYTMKESGTGSVTVSVLGGSVSDPAAIVDATIESFEGSNQEDDSAYTRVDIYFNSGDNTIISIYGTNVGVESRLDAFELSFPAE